MTERKLFEAALELPPEGRAAYLDSVCGTDAALRQRLEALLRKHDEASRFLEVPPPELARTVHDPSIEAPGTRVGPYKLLEQIGDGGFGIVFMADQLTPVRRRVALKIIKPGMDTRQVLARFEVERQALAMMDHTNIARALDAGATDSGRPYFVMELVRGVPITEYCDQNHLAVHERLELFVSVCRAVQHAHQKGIIHRDIKPSNVLITMQDGRPVPKMIDFGIAKAINQQLTEETLFTRFAEMIGTPLYMSPEQAAMTSLDIDTRSDIYSLGVLLYELLTGTTPFDRHRLKKAAYDEIRRIIREEEPARPSTRLSTLGDKSAAVAAHRHADPSRLSQLVRGDLDWIVMKALEKDRTRRYETANDLALEIERHLADEPVLARPPSTAYRFRKFARRNKAALATAVVVTAALLLGVVGTTWQAFRATWQRDRAVSAEKLAATRLASESSARAAEAEQRREAETEREHVEVQRQQALTQQHIARREELAARRNLYTARITLAEENFEKAKTGYALALLEAERPAPDREDLRGFEWYHLWWRCHQGHRLTLRGHRGGVGSVVFSPDGKTLASGSADGTVRLWDAATGQTRTTLLGNTAPVNCVAFSPDGKTLASGCRDGTTRLWDVATGGERATIWGRKDPVAAVAFSPDGTILAMSTGQATTKLWDVATRKERASFSTPDAMRNPQSLVFFPNAKRLAIGTSNNVKLCDVETGQVRSTVSGDRMALYSIALSADGKTLATSGFEGIRLFDVESSHEGTGLKVGLSYPTCVAFSPDAKTVGLGTYTGDVVLWDPRTGQKRIYAHPARVRSVAFSPDGKTLASASDDRTVMLWEVSTQTPPGTRAISMGHLWCVAISPDGKTAAVAGDSGRVKLLDIATMQELGDLVGHTATVVGVAFGPDGKSLASCGDDCTIRLWDPSTRQERALLKGHAGPVYSVDFSPDGKTLASGSGDQTVKLWNVATRQVRADLRGHTKSIWTVAFSPDGKTLASGGDDSTIKLWEAASGRELRTLRGHSSKVGSVAFSHDGGTLFSTDYLTMRTWDATTGQPRETLRPIENMALMGPCAALADGRTLAIGSQAALKLWDVATGRERATLNAHTGEISSVAISPDNRIIATTSYDGSAKFWRTATEQDVLRQSSDLDLREKLGQSDTKEALQLKQDREAYFTNRVEQRPDDPLAWFDRGLFFVSGGQWKRAADDFQHAVKFGLDEMDYLEEIAQFFETHGTRDQVLGAVSNEPGLEKLRLEPFNEAAWAASYLDAAAHFLPSKGRSPAAEEIVRRFLSRIEALRSAISGKVDHRELLPRVHHELANSFRDLKRKEDSESHYHQALVHYDALVAALPTNSAYRLERARCHRDLALMFQSAGRPADAEQEYRQALALEEKLVADEPANPDCRRDLAYSDFGFADFLRYNKRTSEVEDFDRRALGLFEKLGDEFPARDNDRLEVGHALWRLGETNWNLGRPDETEKYLRRSLAVFEKLAADFPQNRYCRWEQCFSDLDIAGLMRPLGRLKDAEKALRDAVDICEKVLAQTPDDGGFQDRLARSHFELADVLRAENRLDEAVKYYRLADAAWRKLADEYSQDFAYRAHVIEICTNQLGPFLVKNGRMGEAEEVYRTAVGLLARFPASELVADDRRDLTDTCYGNLIRLLKNSNRSEEAKGRVSRMARPAPKKPSRSAWQQKPKSAAAAATLSVTLWFG